MLWFYYESCRETELDLFSLNCVGFWTFHPESSIFNSITHLRFVRFVISLWNLWWRCELNSLFGMFSIWNVFCGCTQIFVRINYLPKVACLREMMEFSFVGQTEVVSLTDYGCTNHRVFWTCFHSALSIVYIKGTHEKLL